ncbi:MAG: glutamine--fructose-6-phosphate transaminase (isomerizing) [Candidatus Aenigmatarchaeota archaeon]
MCGIVGICGKNRISVSELIKSLKRLEYRGYDSYGFVTDSGFLFRKVGEISFSECFANEFNMAISHTRWATHGKISEKNAHPHYDCNKNLFIVHNGIIENYLDLKNILEKKEHVFSSETDSEVIAHYFEDKLNEGKKIEQIIPIFFNDAKGTYAVLILCKNSNKIYAFKKDSPLVLGLVDNMNIIASDIFAFSDKTNKAIFFDDYEFAIIDANNYEFYNKNGEKINKNINTFEWCKDKLDKKFEHFMIKEIYEEPIVAERLLQSLRTTQKNKIEELKTMIINSKKIIFVASGTSYHASLLGVYFLHKVGLEAQAIIASEFMDFANFDENTLVIAISQSGETMDVINALKIAKQKNAKIASIVNVPYSTVQRMSNLSIEILAGQEICVAATKSFVNQVILLLYLAKEFGLDVKLDKISDEIKLILKQENKIKKLAEELKNKNDIYIIGRGLSYPVAREIALKLKEISYIHAEGMMGGELKHGTLALIENGTPVIALINGNHHIVSNINEAMARGAEIFAITNNGNVKYKKQIKIKTEHDGSFSILATIVGQLLTYYIARERGLPVDKPRNLAKSCTVL